MSDGTEDGGTGAEKIELADRHRASAIDRGPVKSRTRSRPRSARSHRVLDVVEWHTITKDDPKEWLYFYEQFLEVYDNALRKRTGSYYTPPEVVSAMVNLVDEALRGPLFERPAGFAAADVIVADPAVGTGTFLLGVLRRIAGDSHGGSRRKVPCAAPWRPRPGASSALKCRIEPSQPWHNAPD